MNIFLYFWRFVKAGLLKPARLQFYFFMVNHPSKSLKMAKKFGLGTTPALPCVVMEDQSEQRTYVCGAGNTAEISHAFSDLVAHGFYREGLHNVFRHCCTDCGLCVPLRTVLEQYDPNESKSYRSLKNKIEIRKPKSIQLDAHYIVIPIKNPTCYNGA